MDEIRTELVEAAVAEARERGCDVADVSLDEVARRVGISRATLYRQVGSRQAFNDAIRARGIDPGGRPEVAIRAVEAAKEIVREHGLAALTLEAVAARADCSVAALHSQLGGREGLLLALYERFSPLPEVEQILATMPPLEDGARAICRAVYERSKDDPRFVQAIVADVLVRPQGSAVRYLTRSYLPRMVGSIRRWLAEQTTSGSGQPAPVTTVFQWLVMPVMMHVATRDLITRTIGDEQLDSDELIDQLVDAFVRATTSEPFQCHDRQGEPRS